MAPIGIDMAKSRYTAKKSGMAAVALLVALAAVPVLADTDQEKAMQSGSPASVQIRQEVEQESYQERLIRRLAGETLPRTRSRYSEASLSEASLQMRQELEQENYQEMVIRRLSGEAFPRAHSKY